MWAFDLKCPVCVKSISLNSKGVYRKVRNVIDLKGRYYLAAEYHQCPTCQGTFISYDDRILNQLPFSLRVRFPILLTGKFASDIGVVNLMRCRTLGNSSTSLWNDVTEMHSDEESCCSVIVSAIRFRVSDLEFRMLLTPLCPYFIIHLAVNGSSQPIYEMCGLVCLL